MTKALVLISLFIGTTIFSFSQQNPIQPVNNSIIPRPDIERLLQEDAINSSRKDIPYRYGVPYKCNINIIASGSKEEVDNNGLVFRYKLTATDAKTLELKFDKFYLPANSELILYNHTGTEVINRFTSKNNRKDQRFSTGMILDNSIVIEYKLPANCTDTGLLNIEKVIYGYKNIYEDEKLGDCYININCPLGSEWQNEKRAVARVTLGSGQYCTGTVVNNTRQDGRQYFLTANHCYEASTDVENWDFYFNYETPTCTGVAPYIPAVAGSTLKARSLWSDFCLLEITEAIPQAYNIYYAGWSNLDIASNSSTVIHHPGGSTKKISQDYDPLGSGSYSGTPNSHWIVADYDTSSTEGGSSGSAIFNENHKIVGQLQGGSALCGNDSWDAYGKFSMSWNYGSTPTTRLKEWLDPDNSGITSIDGWDPDVPNTTTDAQMLNILKPQTDFCTSCDNAPAFIIRNLGANPLTDLQVHYKYDNNNIVTQTWSGNLSYMQTDTVYFQAASFPSGTHTFKAFLSNPNNLQDEFRFNDTMTISINGTAGQYFELDLTGKKYYEDEISWSIKNSSNQTLYSGNSYSTPYPYVQLHIIQNFCLQDGCYTFTINDNNCGGTTPGRYYFTNITTGDTIGSGCNSGTSDILQFCVTYCETPITSEITGTVNTYVDSTYTYSVNNTAGSTYNWEVTGGSIVAGQNSNQISVIWNNAGTGSVSVSETNSQNCTGDTATINVSVTIFTNSNFAQTENNPFVISESFDKLIITLDHNYSVELLDVTGKTIRSFNSDEVSINKNELSKGIYFLKINSHTPFVKKIFR